MKIILENIGRRFNREWIFRNIDFQFEQGLSYAVLGPNGSGKSTLLQLIAGSLTPSAGSIEYLVQGFPISTERIFGEISMTAPYLELIEELSLVEHIDFHFKFKSYRGDHDKYSVVELLKLHNSENKAIKYFSSGMKQRLKLALSFCSDTPVYAGSRMVFVFN
jgi:ABC-type multidrug transport system ATPase subunit